MTLELNRIYNMDCLEGMRQIEDKSIDLVITDPPYGIGENNKQNMARGTSSPKWKRAKPKDYGDFEWDAIKITTEYIEEVLRISKNQIVFGGNYYSDIVPQSTCWIVWDKKNNGDFADCELAWTSFPSAVRMFTYRWSGFLKEEPEERFHPTQKPVKLFEWIIKNYAKEGDTICDPFFGSGSCLVACIRMGHQFIGFEKEKTYFDAAQIRIKKAQEQGKIGTWF
jgi:site-specific DNA-methyltransferase (adenine-specific)